MAGGGIQLPGPLNLPLVMKIFSLWCWHAMHMYEASQKWKSICARTGIYTYVHTTQYIAKISVS